MGSLLSQLAEQSNFSLTVNIYEQIFQRQEQGTFSSRLVYLVCTPLTELIDTLAHLALGLINFSLTPLCLTYNLNAWFDEREERLSVTFVNGLVHIKKSLEHLIGIITFPLISAFDPQAACQDYLQNKYFNDLTERVSQLEFNEKTLEKEVKKNKKLIEDLDEQKILLRTLTKKWTADSTLLQEENIKLREEVSLLKEQLEESSSIRQDSKSNSESYDSSEVSLEEDDEALPLIKNRAQLENITQALKGLKEEKSSNPSIKKAPADPNEEFSLIKEREALLSCQQGSKSTSESNSSEEAFESLALAQNFT